MENPWDTDDFWHEVSHLFGDGEDLDIPVQYLSFAHKRPSGRVLHISVV